MVTRKRTGPISKPPATRRVQLFLREWRKFMGVSAVDCAEALGIERESYLRLEREPWRVTVAELDLIAPIIGVSASQIRFPPPKEGQPERVSLDEMIEGESPELQQMAIRSVRAMIGK